MIKTQIQLPDALYRELKRLAEEREMSLAELLRRGAEYITQVYRPQEDKGEAWKLPGPFHAGVQGDPFTKSDWRYEMNLGASASALVVREPPPPPAGSKRRRTS